ncbi:hypothetical protein [uncultured Tateyamaria sp.]|uniref:hypothetical protein n=1 Tax=uncultured Tateyamaria sp. TaxID=455651 RepID=UPI002631F4B6|nr:hypothetical protein [uncultured Tateyamaria sp.]
MTANLAGQLGRGTPDLSVASAWGWQLIERDIAVSLSARIANEASSLSSSEVYDDLKMTFKHLNLVWYGDERRSNRLVAFSHLAAAWQSDTALLNALHFFSDFEFDDGILYLLACGLGDLADGISPTYHDLELTFGNRDRLARDRVIEWLDENRVVIEPAINSYREALL